jgi:putative addiction module component (TIGR02574 family)
LITATSYGKFVYQVLENHMEFSETSQEIKKLSVAERILLVEEIWDSIVAEQESLELTEAQRQELDRRLESYQSSPEVGSSWEEVKQSVTADK